MWMHALTALMMLLHRVKIRRTWSSNPGDYAGSLSNFFATTWQKKQGKMIISKQISQQVLAQSSPYFQHW